MDTSTLTDLMSSFSVAVTSPPAAPTPNAVSFSGTATVRTRLVRDPIFGRPSMLFLIALQGVEGITQLGTRRFPVTAEEHIVRPLASTFDLSFNFVVSPDGSGSIATSQVGLANVRLKLNPNTGIVSSLTATLRLA